MLNIIIRQKGGANPFLSVLPFFGKKISRAWNNNNSFGKPFPL
ncbi:MAG: hypothetical protein BAJALOKI2v1_240013 [Promethearchaeota archaeon]|nr:MAG: hypothetical protein BAJALOKI2v1_240013 [Candidatus Lokiarchaeota archaeon]